MGERKNGAREGDTQEVRALPLLSLSRDPVFSTLKQAPVIYGNTIVWWKFS